MLVGRAVELGALEALLARVRAGQGGALLLRGEAGAGKTTLLEAVARVATISPAAAAASPPAAAAPSPRALCVLRARGVEGEAELGFSALADLLTPVADGLGELPAPQAAALAAALALGPPAPGDRLAVCVATVGLLRVAARRRPVLVLVDDLHWLDAPSRECVLYAARRARAGVGVVMATRTPHAAEALPVAAGPLARRRAGRPRR